MPNVGPMELLLLGILAVVIFGPAKLPEIGRSIGRATREFKESISGTGIQEALDGVGEVRSAMSPTNLVKAATPAPLKEMASDVTGMKDTLKDPLGLKTTEAEAKDEPEKPTDTAAPAPAPVAPEPPVAPQA
jgi:TatA/E family protein of Tat protein translocase